MSAKLAGGKGTEKNYLQDLNKKWESFEDQVEDYWDDFLDVLEDEKKSPEAVRWFSVNFLRRITIEAPVIISFCTICVIIHILSKTILPGLNTFLAVPDTLSLSSPLQIPRLFTHVIAHDGTLAHIKGNITHILLVGPSAEHVFGSQALLIVIVVVALSSGLAHILLGSTNTHQLGASGVVFAVILLNSLVAAKSGKIPITFLLTAGMWGADELYKLLFVNDGVSHHAHLTGAIVGSVFAYYIRGKQQLEIQQKRNLLDAKSPRSIINAWRTHGAKPGNKQA
jgi:membrane associated rhomboid family serine protease